MDGDGTLEAASGDADPQYWLCYDESWRVVAAYRKTDAAPKERFVYHAAGLGGFGDGSYIDALVLREKDANAAWNAASDTLEQRIYYLQNWRADVVALVNDFGLPLEYVRYSPYGVPTRTPISEYNGDGASGSVDAIGGSKPGKLTGDAAVRAA